jgi:exosome complex component RRP41
MKAGQPEKLIVNGKRLDGRGFNEMRKLELEVNVLKKANGSATFKFGNSYALSAVFGPKEMHPRHLLDPEKAVLKCKYSMAPFSTQQRIRPGYSRRSIEISKVINEALSNVIFFEDHPRTGLDVFIQILQADASTRCTGLNAASLALADAGIPMKDLVSSVAVGKVDGQIVLDVDGPEDNYGEVDLATATVGGKDKFVLLQMDGIVTKKEFMQMIELAKNACKEIYEKQKQAIETKYGEINE